MAERLMAYDHGQELRRHLQSQDRDHAEDQMGHHKHLELPEQSRMEY